MAYNAGNNPPRRYMSDILDIGLSMVAWSHQGSKGNTEDSPQQKENYMSKKDKIKALKQIIEMQDAYIATMWDSYNAVSDDLEVIYTTGVIPAKEKFELV